MFTHWQAQKDTTFCMFNENGPQHLASLYRKSTAVRPQAYTDAKELFEFNGLEKYCYVRKSNGNCSIGSKKEKLAEMQAAEEELINSLRILDGENYFDTLAIHERLLEKADRVIQIFDTISNEQAFTNINEKQFDNPTKNPAWCNPIWFTANSFERFGSWVVSQFERTIIFRYFEFKKNPSKLKNIFSDLEYKRKLTDFWKFTKSPKRKKLYITVHKIFSSLKAFQQEKQKLLASETLKDRKYYLYLFYKHFCSENEKTLVTGENILEKFMETIHEKDETRFIENLLETPFSRFGSTTNIVARRVSEKLRDCYANKMFESLSQNDKSFQSVFFDEDKSKPAKKKKNKKKKSKSTKTSAASSQLTTPFAAGIDLPQGSTGQPFSLDCGDSTEPAVVKAADEIEIYTQQMAKLLIEKAISGFNVSSEAVEEKQQQQPQSVNTSTVANSETAEQSTATGSKKNKKKKKKAQIAGSVTIAEIAHNKETVIGQESESKKELEPNESEIELRANASAAGDSNHTFDLSIFDELNKKVSRNKKKKLKKKMKKDRLKKGQNLDEPNQTDFMSYLIDTKILRELSFHEKFENIMESTCENMWDTTTDGTSVRTLLGVAGEAGQHKDKLSSLMSRSGTPNDESDTEEKSVSEYSAVTTQAATDSKVRDEEKKTPSPRETIKNSETSTSKQEEKKSDKKERFRLVPKNYKSSNNTSMVQDRSGPSSLNNSSYIYRPQQSQQLSHLKAYTQLTDSDLAGFTEVKGKKKKSQPVPEKTTPSTSKAEKTYYSKYQYEEKKPKPSQTLSRSTQQNVVRTPDPKEKTTIAKSEPSSKEKQVVVSEKKAGVEGNSVQETLKELLPTKSQTHQPEKTSQGSNETTTKSAPPKTETKKKPLRLNPSAPPLKLNVANEDTQKKAAFTKVVNHIYEERVEKDINNYIKKLINESNVLEDFRRVTFNRLQFIISNALSAEGRGISIKPYGSCVTGLALNFSDIDIAVSGVFARDREHLLSLLQTIYDKLKEFGWVKDPKLISTASLPVLKIEVNPSIDISTGEYTKDPALQELVDGITDKQWYDMNLKEYQKDESIQIRIDISIEDGFLGHIGVLSTDFVSKMLEYHEPLYSLTLIIKQLLSEKDLLNRFQGGISSYCLVVMLVAYLRTSKQPGIARNFLDCVRFYGKEFDPKTTGINLCFDPNPIYKFISHPEQSPFYLYDRLRFDRNLGHTTTKIDQILKEFSNIDDYLTSYKQCLEKVVMQNAWSSIQAVENKVLNSHPELQAFKNKNLLEEIFQVSNNK